MASGALLDEYIQQGPSYIDVQPMPEHDYHGDGKGSNAGLSWTAQAYNLTSQTWLSTDDWGAAWGGKDAQWWHVMYIITPSVLKSEDYVSMYITDGTNTDPVPSASSENIAVTAGLAMATGQIQVVLLQVPNYPLYLIDSKTGEQTPALGDDDLLAHTFSHYMDFIKEGGNVNSLPDASWVVLLPMVKAAFAAMAATEDTLQRQQPQKEKLKWIITGASKRGWTTWLVGAVDSLLPVDQQRVKGIVPIVLNGLHFDKTLKHQFQVYGAWSFAMRAFVDVGFTGRIDSDEIQPLWGLIDPYTYLSRLSNTPTLVCSMVGDEFFVLDSSRYWYEEARNFNKNSLSVAMFPDAEHSSATAIPALIPTIGGFETNLAGGNNKAGAPQVSFTLDYSQGSITLSISPEYGNLERTVQSWRSTTCKGDKPRRDFRMINIDKQTTGSCPCGPDISDSQCFNLRAGIWQNATLVADTTLDTQGLTYRIDSDGNKQQQYPALRNWEAMFIAVTFHDAAPGMRNDASVGGAGMSGGRSDSSSCEGHVIGGRKFCLPVVKPADMVITSNVMVLPDTVPFDCYGEDCLGTLV